MEQTEKKPEDSILYYYSFIGMQHNSAPSVYTVIPVAYDLQFLALKCGFNCIGDCAWEKNVKFLSLLTEN